MTTAHFPRADFTTTRFGFGCASLMRLTTARERKRLLAAAVDGGLHHFDAARMYGLGRVEGELGTFIKGRREDITIATKFGIEPAPGITRLARLSAPARVVVNRYPKLRRVIRRHQEALNVPRRYDAETARRSLDKSLLELDVDRVDILFVHDPGPQDDVRVDELAEFFAEARQAGKIGAWGVSQDAWPELDLVSRLGRPALLQVREDVLSRRPRHDPRFSFGVLGASHAHIQATLQTDDAMRRRWTDALGDDPLSDGRLATLLLADALAANPQGVVLFSTVRPARVQVATRALQDPPPEEVLRAFTTLIALDALAVQTGPARAPRR